MKSHKWISQTELQMISFVEYFVSIIHIHSNGRPFVSTPLHSPVCVNTLGVRNQQRPLLEAVRILLGRSNQTLCLMLNPS